MGWGARYREWCFSWVITITLHSGWQIVFFVIFQDCLDIEVLEFASSLLSLLHPVANRELIFFLYVSQIAFVQDLRETPPTIKASKIWLSTARVNSILIIVVLCNFDIESHDLVANIFLYLFIVLLLSLSGHVLLILHLILLFIWASHRCIIPWRHADMQGKRETTNRRLITVVIIIICTNSTGIIAFLLGFQERELTRGWCVHKSQFLWLECAGF